MLMPETPSLPVRLPFEIDDQIDPTLITAHAGVPLVIELFRRVGAAQVINEQVRIKQRQRGLTAAQLVETLIALWTAGGDRCQDLQTLRADVALATLLGYELPAATTMRDFLETFHVDTPPLWRAGEKAVIPEESAPLAGVGAANRRVLAAVQQQAPRCTATLDVDATILEAHKRTAAVTYCPRRIPGRQRPGGVRQRPDSGAGRCRVACGGDAALRPGRQRVV
jgi:hypothetical protein